MREIKFRAWNKEMKYMSPVGQLNGMKSVLIYVPEQTSEDGDFDWNGDVIPMEKVELMQFTGLLDKNGKEIYEGDIVLHDDILFKGVKGVCIFHRDGFLLDRIESEEWPNAHVIFGRVSSSSQVIGNIYENPELLVPPPTNI